MTTGFGFKPVHAFGGGDVFLIHPEIQDDQAFTEGLPQYAYQKHDRAPFLQFNEFDAKIAG